MNHDEFRAAHATLVDSAKAVTKLDLTAFFNHLSRFDFPVKDAGRRERLRRLAGAAMVLRGEMLSMIREELGGVAEEAGLSDDEVSSLAGDPRNPETA